MLTSVSSTSSSPLRDGVAQMGGTLDTRTLNKIRLAVETLAADRDNHMNAAEMQVFIYAAIQPGVTQKELAERIGIAQSETSRIVTKFMSLNGEGYGLLLSEEDPHERRRKVIRLTPKGRKLADRLIALFN